ncbi:MAG: carotenoid 1,2-hydratase [Steroidobacteraceae bacterium]
MTFSRRIAAFLLSLLLTPAYAADRVDYPVVAPGASIEFPRDEGSHPQFRTEWWYVTGTVADAAGATFGFQVTFFRSRPGVDEANPSRFAAKQLLFAHAALSDPKRGHLLHDERSARAGFDIAEAAENSLNVVIDDWSLRAQQKGYRATVRTPDFQLEFDYLPTQPPLLHGARGYSQKGPSPEAASYYYTLPQLRTSGRLTIGAREYKVTGTAWMDHEWSSSILDEQAQGWDWVGINLDDGGAVMAFQMRDLQGAEHFAAATIRDGGSAAPVAFAPADIEWSPRRRWRSVRTGIEYPVEWMIRIGTRTLTLRPVMDDQENDARGSTGTIYWEGAVEAFDAEGRRVGRGYLELTGYGRRVRL